MKLAAFLGTDGHAGPVAVVNAMRAVQPLSMQQSGEVVHRSLTAGILGVADADV